MSPGAAGDKEPCVWLLAAGVSGVMRASGLKAGFKKSL
jgi:hypothetical protein